MSEEKNYIEGQLLLTFKRGVSLKEAKKIIAPYKLSILTYMSTLNIALVAVPKGKEEQWQRKLQKNDKIEIVAFNGKVELIR